MVTPEEWNVIDKERKTSLDRVLQALHEDPHKSTLTEILEELWWNGFYNGEDMEYRHPS